MTGDALQHLLSLLTLDEKIAMVHGATLFKTGSVPSQDIPAFTFSDGPMGPRMEYLDSDWMPIGGNDDYTSYLPCGSAIAATFNRQRAYEAGQVLGAEARGRGKDMLLGPGLNIHRSPLCGRNFEYISEDPYLASAIAVPLIKGIQESDVSACVKHYTLNNQETIRTSYCADVSERALWEIYLPAFRAAVLEGDTMGMMGSYNRYKEEYVCESKELIDQILRSEWGFEGILVSDWSAITDTERAAKCQIDVDMGINSEFDEYHFALPLKKAIEEGKVSESDLDQKVLHLLHIMDRLHMLESDRSLRARGHYNMPKDRETLLRTAEESIVLLKNEQHTLPLDPDKLHKIVMIGDNADRIHAAGGGSAEIKALYEISPLLGMKMLLGGNCEVLYEPGYYCFVTGNAWTEDTAQNAMIHFANLGDFAPRQERMAMKNQIPSLNKRYLKQALEAAAKADAVIYVGGLNHDHDVEGRDRSDYHLPYNQDEFISRLLEVRPDTIITLIGGSPVSTSAWADKAGTILYQYYSGMESGLALARILLGMVSPSGKLPTTFPKELSDSPAHSTATFADGKNVPYAEDVFVGYRHFISAGIQPAFAFGHGLSYASFSYADLTVTQHILPSLEMYSIRDSKPLCSVTFTVANISEICAMETAQIYVAPLETTLRDAGGRLIRRPARELRGFEKQMIQAHDRNTYSCSLPPVAFSYYDETLHCYVAPAGTYEIQVASASNRIHLTAHITLDKELHISRS